MKSDNPTFTHDAEELRRENFPFLEDIRIDREVGEGYAESFNRREKFSVFVDNRRLIIITPDRFERIVGMTGYFTRGGVVGRYAARQLVEGDGMHLARTTLLLVAMESRIIPDPVITIPEEFVHE
jgi:hypothetical protein